MAKTKAKKKKKKMIKNNGKYQNSGRPGSTE